MSSKETVYQVVVASIAEIQKVSGRPQTRLTGSTRPMADLEGFDSLNAVEASISFSGYLGKELPQDVALFYSPSTGKPNTIDQIVDAVYTLLEKQGKQESA